MNRRYKIISTAIFFLLVPLVCRDSSADQAPLQHPEIPRGYVERLEIQVGDQVLTFGPFVGYYFRLETLRNIDHLTFLCFNEDSFYTKDIEPNALLYRGTAIFQRLDEKVRSIPKTGKRIVPVFFSEAPAQWKKSRPKPQQRFVHFHSAHNMHGAVYSGFWLDHVAEKSFTYDMGGRVGASSPLYHHVKPGPDLDFAHIIEFDHGP